LRFFAYLSDLVCGAVPLCLLGVGAYFLVRLGVYPFCAAARCFFSLFVPKKEAKEALLQHTGAYLFSFQSEKAESSASASACAP
jgi:hypothetical protein